MMLLKNKLAHMLPCIALLVLFATVNYNILKTYYDEILNNSGLIYEDMEKELKKENKKAAESEKEYQDLLRAEDNSNIQQEEKEQKFNTPPKDLKLHALSALLLDAANDRVLYEENGYKEMPMASTTKIMTCIVTLENANLDDVVTISQYAAKMPDVQLNVRPGEQYYLRDLLFSLMLESHNDVAVAIAEHVGGSVEGFATMMNDKARELGCEHTNFVTPNGLDAQGHHTTARDLAVIASYAIKNQKFIDVTNTTTHEFKELKMGRSFRVTNKNRFLYMMEGAIGVKTGFTSDAGYCFVGAIKRSDRTLISVVLGCGWPPKKQLKWSDTKELMDYGIENYQVKQIFQEIDLDPIFVNKGQKKYEALALEGDLKLLMREDETVHVEYDLPKVIQAPVNADQVIGHAKYFINDIYYTEVPIYTAETIPKIDFRFCFQKILRLWSLQY
jgi:serine-type D-Ala-D-Ala carboxypeptidase (penicillin-binding protein 5/6)